MILLEDLRRFDLRTPPHPGSPTSPVTAPSLNVNDLAHSFVFTRVGLSPLHFTPPVSTHGMRSPCPSHSSLSTSKSTRSLGTGSTVSALHTHATGFPTQASLLDQPTQGAFLLSYLLFESTFHAQRGGSSVIWRGHINAPASSACLTGGQ